MSQSKIERDRQGWTSVTRKVISASTGLALVGFVVVHLIGNLQLFLPEGEAFNKYAFFLESQGILLYIAEIGLVLFFLFHAIAGIQVFRGKRRAKKIGYKKYQSAGAPSKQSLSSKTMIVSGLVILLFLFLHLATFKYNLNLENIPTTTIKYIGDNVEVRDLHKIVYDAFQSPVVAFGYTAVMILLGFHLRHGFWSAFQSLGAMKPKYTPVFYTAGGILAFLLALGFLTIPLYIYFTGGA